MVGEWSVSDLERIWSELTTATGMSVASPYSLTERGCSIIAKGDPQQVRAIKLATSLSDILHE